MIKIIENYRRRSVEGWSVINNNLDFLGGLLSFLQLVLDGYITDNLANVFTVLSI